MPDLTCTVPLSLSSVCGRPAVPAESVRACRHLVDPGPYAVCSEHDGMPAPKATKCLVCGEVSSVRFVTEGPVL